MTKAMINNVHLPKLIANMTSCNLYKIDQLYGGKIGALFITNLAIFI
jgi:hypothetical protein